MISIAMGEFVQRVRGTRPVSSDGASVKRDLGRPSKYPLGSSFGHQQTDTLPIAKQKAKARRESRNDSSSQASQGEAVSINGICVPRGFTALRRGYFFCVGKQLDPLHQGPPGGRSLLKLGLAFLMVDGIPKCPWSHAQATDEASI